MEQKARMTAKDPAIKVAHQRLSVRVCKIICASVLSHKESSTMGKKGRRSKWRTKSASDY